MIRPYKTALSDPSLLVCAGPGVSYLIPSLKLSDMGQHIAVHQSYYTYLTASEIMTIVTLAVRPL